MKLPQKVTDLLEELDSEIEIDSSAEMKIHCDSEKKSYEFDSNQCSKLLASAEAVERLFEALGEPKDAIVEISGVSVENDVVDSLDANFADVNFQ